MKRLAYLFAALAITACSSSDNNNNNNNNGPINALSLPDRVEALSAQQLSSNSQAGLQRLSNSFLPLAFNDPGTDFSNDETYSYIYDTDIEYIRTLNYLLCFMNKFEYQRMLNEGPYVASINWTICAEEFYPGSSKFITKPIFEATAISSRADNNSPHIVKIWLPDIGNESQSSDAGAIETKTLIEFIIGSSAGDVSPLGEFSINWATIEDAGQHNGTVGQEIIAQRGSYVASVNNQGEAIFKAIDLPLDTVEFYNYERFNFKVDSSNANSGMIRSELSYTPGQTDGNLWNFNNTRATKAAYNTETLSLEPQRCLARDETRGSLFGYNLYHRDDGNFDGKVVNAGQRVNRNGSFSFTYNGQSGWMTEEYYWLESGVLPDNASIEKFDFGTGSSQNLTAIVSPGKLYHQHKQEELLSSFQGRDFVYFGQHPAAAAGSLSANWIIQINANNQFDYVALQSWNGQSYTETSTFDHDSNPSTAEIAVAATLALTPGQYLSLRTKMYDYYSYTHDPAIAAENRVLRSDRNDVVRANDSTLFPQGVNEVSLYCYQFCIKGGLSQQDIDSATSIYDLYHDSWNIGATARQYTATKVGHKVLLMDNTSSPAVSTDLTQLDLSRFTRDYLSSGKLLTQALSGVVDASSLSAIEDSYSFTTGKSGSYQTVTLLDDNNNTYNFDQPLIISYQYNAAHDMYDTDPLTNPNHGKTFTLYYYDTGSLAGLPFNKDEQDNAIMTVNLRPGTELSLSSGGQTNHFVVKALWEAQTMLAKDSAECAGLSLNNLLQDPDLQLLTPEEIAAPSFTTADEPVVTDPPAVKPEVS